MRTPARIAASAAVVAALLLVFAASPGMGAPPPPIDLRVDGGEEGWRAHNSFKLEWEPPATGSDVHAVVYRLLRQDGSVAVEPIRMVDPPPWIDPVVVPGPGQFRAEVWFEDGLRLRGPSSSVTLRFDDVRPGTVPTILARDWIGRAALPRAIRIGAPAPPHPPSGIRGYAVSIDQMPEGSPCATNSSAPTARRTSAAGPRRTSTGSPTCRRGPTTCTSSPSPAPG